MAQLGRSSITAKSALSGVIEKMAPKKKTEEVVVFRAEDRVSLEGMSSDDFYSHFADFARLLVEKTGRIVVAASRSGECSELTEAYRKTNPAVDDFDLILWSGPKALTQTAKAEFAERARIESKSPTRGR